MIKMHMSNEVLRFH